MSEDELIDFRDILEEMILRPDSKKIHVGLSILRHKNHKKHILKHSRFFTPRVKQYASARMAVGIKIIRKFKTECT